MTKEGGKVASDGERSDGVEDEIDGIGVCSGIVSGTSEFEDICFVLKSELGLSHDETQPGAQQHNKILPLVSPPPPPPPANQEPADPEETLHQPRNPSSSSPPYFSTSLLFLCCIHFIWELLK